MKINSFKFYSIIFCTFLWSTFVMGETLRVGMECTYAPFNYKNANGELVGYDVDVAKGVARIIGSEINFVCQEWDGMIPALLANKFDLVIASMSITEKRMRAGYSARNSAPFFTKYPCEKIKVNKPISKYNISKKTEY